ncbi:PrsW family intramembrane metalloprotease [Modestobacter muralis]|uniref:PrsW family intramembrane metalloprotease n=1 Tax=Modestobacter muralis TaxID=1608614 RepID=A0A6P0H1H5_9ACTN|nr:PrsW family glutamic-type intramembrane protease [Modestobacter muralis]NEK92634.1 PrsW family intramembrane metalloprotease [Modestobacter muralis]NEN49401.1 PrsW family intramembrane metalloprotease [Modestobacter muralis]
MGHARRWSWLLVLLGGLALYELIQRAIAETGNPNLLPALLLLGAAVVPTAFVTFIAGRRLVFAVGAGTVLLTALVGGVIGVVTAGVLEYNTLQRLGALPMLSVGLIEEAAKLILPAAVLLFVRRDRHPADGLLLGVACGAGFAVLETMGYAFVVLVQSRGDLEVVDSVLFLRGVLSPAAHMAWTALAAAALWRAAAQHWHAAEVGRFVLAFVVVVALHTAWDLSGSTVAYAVLSVVSLTLLAVVSHRLAAPHRREPVAGRRLASV